MSKKWLVVYTRPRFEKKIEKYLNDRDIICYLPLYKTLRQWSDRKKWVELPLFSSYVFVKVDDQDYQNVLKADGVLRYVTFEGAAVEIPEGQIENIKWILSSDISTEPIHEPIPTGSIVEVIKGPLKGLIAELVKYKNKKIVVVRLEQLDKSLEIIIPGNHLKTVHLRGKK
jgi:transcriptional antiterminator RfaH